MADALDSVFAVDRRRSELEWRAALEALARALSQLVQHEVVVTGVHASDDDPAHACWAATAYIHILVSRVPLLEWSGTIGVTVNVGEAAAVSSDLFLFADRSRVAGPAGADLFHLLFTSDRGWVPRGWMWDAAGEWEAETTLSSPPSSEADDGVSEAHAQLEIVRRRLQARGLFIASRFLFGSPGIVVALSRPEDALSPVDRPVHLYRSRDGWTARLTPHGGPHWIRVVDTAAELESIAVEAVRSPVVPPNERWWRV